MSEKTEQPTPKKLRDARKKGQVASSKEVASTALILSILSYLWLMSGAIMDDLRDLMNVPILLLDAPFGFALQQALAGVGSIMVRILVPILGLVIVVAILSYFFQFGLLFSFEPLKPSLKKLNPFEGVKRIVSMKTLVEFIKSIIKITVLFLVLFVVIRDSIRDLVLLPYCGTNCILPVLGNLLRQLIMVAAIVFVIVAAADLLYQRHAHTKKLMMTKDEVKREFKEMEGDPHIKAKRKQIHQEMLAQNIVNSVKRASVVVTNPTRIAVALRYKQGETPLPVVVAKGENLLARRMIEIAREEGVPVMENVPLARALHEQVQIDQYIPADLIEATAEVLRWVARLERSKDKD